MTGYARARAPYAPMWRTPFAAVLAWALSGIGLAAWIWRAAPLLDERPDLTKETP